MHFKAMRYESISFDKIVADDELHPVIRNFPVQCGIRDGSVEISMKQKIFPENLVNLFWPMIWSSFEVFTK